MKNLTTLLATTILMGSLALTSCKKNKNEDPTPTTPTDTTTTGGGNTGGGNTGGGNTGSGGTTYVPQITVNTNGALVAPANVDITATITNLITDSIAKVELLDGSTVLASITTAPFGFSRTALAVGVYNYTVKVTTKNGTVTTEPVSFTVVAANIAPVFNSTDLGQLISSSSTFSVNINTIVSDQNSDPITITSAASTSGVTINGISGTSFNIIAPNKQYAGQVTIAVTISDGKTTTTSNITAKIGSSAQAITYGIMSGFLNIALQPNPTYLTFNSNGTCSASNVVNFWGASCTTGTWSINTDGTLRISNGCNNGTNTYNVTLNSGFLTLTNINNTSYVWYGK